MNLKKLAAGVLACTMSMLLFGCELVSVNTQRDNAQVIVSIGDKTYSKEFVNSMVNSMLSMYGVEDVNSSEYDEYRTEMAESFATEKALAYYAIQNGYKDKLTEEDYTSVNEEFAEIEKYYNEDIYNEAKTNLGYTDEEGAPEFDESAKAKVDKEVAEKQKEYLLGLGVSNLDEYKNELIEKKASELYTEHLKGTVTVSDEEIKAAYDTKLAEQKSTYDSTPSSYINDQSGENTVVYVPSGLRRVKNLLIKIDDGISETITTLEEEIAALEDGEEKTNKQTELDLLKENAYLEIQSKADEALKQAKNGANFDTLIEKYGEDEGAKTNPDGYLMHESATGLYVEEFQSAGMALENIGDISELVKTEFGYHILMYASDVQGGEVALDTVKDAIKTETLTTKQDKAVQEKTTEVMDKYKKEGVVKLYLDRLKKATVPGKK